MPVGGRSQGEERWVRMGNSRDLILGDDALSTKPVMHICEPLILATKWSCSQQSLLSAGGRLQLHLVAGIRGTQINIT